MRSTSCALIPHLVLALAAAACGKPKPEPEPATPTERAAAIHAEASRRLLQNHVINGRVATRTAAGAPEHQGEGLLWAGVAMANLRCLDAQVIADDLASWATHGGGALTRFEPLPAEYIGKESNYDEETGLDAGVAGFVLRCPAESLAIRAAWLFHRDMMAAHGGEVYPGTGEHMTAFAFTGEAITHAVGGGDAPSPAAQWAMEKAAAATALDVKITGRACYPAHLAYRHLRAAEALGYTISPAGRAEFCAAADGLGIRNIEEWCGRGGLAAWIETYVWNRYEYEFQRCPAREAPDGHGDTTPALDLIEAIKQVYSIGD